MGQSSLVNGKSIVNNRMSRRCPVDVPYMSRICLVSYKIRDIYEASTGHVPVKPLFAGSCLNLNLERAADF
jgi:hypothetical protein